MGLPQRKHNRLPDYDYSQNGGYFITICTKDKQKLFWSTVGARIARPQGSHEAQSMQAAQEPENAHPQPVTVTLSPAGLAVEEAIQHITAAYPAVAVNKYVVMPNHVHLLLFTGQESSGRPMAAPTISTVINQMKGYASKRIGFSCWQKSFHDHVIRGQKDYEMIWQYIDTNPAKWELDCFYCE